MPAADTWLHWQGDDLLLTLKVQPRASRDEIVGPYGEALKIRITAPPLDGRANEHLIGFMAREFGVSRHAITLVSGDQGRHKRLRIHAPTRLPSAITRP
ncbi:MAG: YggU family protein [Gammaproteobacteria bacterium]|nr:YggU family protein [Gammaproteobacteria bacterium]